jgi:hypothetical protein
MHPTTYNHEKAVKEAKQRQEVRALLARGKIITTEKDFTEPKICHHIIEAVPDDEGFTPACIFCSETFSQEEASDYWDDARESLREAREYERSVI